MIDNNKICFITCVNDKTIYQKSLSYINNLVIPEGFSVEMIPIENINYMTKGYNYALSKDNAKYKVYIHQDVYFNNKDFLIEMLDIFKNNPQIGIMGVVGSEDIPKSGIWWNSNKKYGKVYDSCTGKMQLLKFHDVSTEYESVSLLDGLIMITQNDIPWREDVFTGWHFYDASQCLEFIKAGYIVAIPKQTEPWCIHDCGIINTANGYEIYRKLFIKEYSSYFK